MSVRPPQRSQGSDPAARLHQRGQAGEKQVSQIGRNGQSRGTAGALAALVAIAAWAAPAEAQQHRQRLYSGAAPGSESWTLPEVVERGSGGGETVSNVRDPEVSVYLPEAAKATGAAVVLLPGGGLRALGLGAMPETIAGFNAHGVAAIVLKYRTLQIPPRPPEPPRGTGPRPPISFPKLVIRKGNANPSPGDKALDTVLRLAVADGQETLRLVRRRAREWNIDPRRVGMLGISAGGGVAFGTLLAGEAGATPDFIVSIYGPSLQDVTVPRDAPPVFLATEADHGPVTDGIIALYSLWKEAGKKAELHVYDVPLFAMPVSLWGDRAFAWMKEQKLLDRPAAQ